MWFTGSFKALFPIMIATQIKIVENPQKMLQIFVRKKECVFLTQD